MGINQKGSPREVPPKAGEAGAVHLLLPVAIVVAVVLISANVQTTTQDDNNIQGVLIAKDGEDNGNSGSSGKGSSNSESSNNSGSNSNSGSGKSQGGPSEEVRIKQEIRTSDERIKTEIREDLTRIDVYQGNTKTRIQQKGNEVIIKTEIEMEDDEASESGEEEASGSADEGEIVQELRAISKFPLRIDLSTNQLIMTKNGVERVLTVLPAKAVQNMLRAHLKKGLGPKFFQGATPSATPEGTPSATATPSGEPTSTPSASPTEEPIATESAQLTILESQISLEEDQGQIVYKIPAKKHLKVFGLIPITTDLTGFVSAETGALLREQESLLARLLDLLSP
ncbi:hypothetical protein HYS94_05085 [Candidatus Daviesbacteria bacterium]|nr:hypothetical protein [Candidatus Daviesbacteria bacterium]